MEQKLLGQLDNIDLLYGNASDQSQYIMAPAMYLNSLFFIVACAVGLKDIKLIRRTNRGDKEVMMNYFGITFATSGSGKDHSLRINKQLFSTGFDSFKDLAEMFYDARNENPSMPDRRYVKLSEYFIDVSSSEQGIQKAAQTISDMQTGSVNVVSDELGDQMGIMEPIFRKLKTAWDDGVSNGPVTASDGGTNYFTVKNIMYNAMLYGSPEIFNLKKDIKEKLISALISGMTRRTFVYYNGDYKKSENRNSNFESMALEEIKKVDEYVKDLRFFINNTPKITLPRDIYSKLQSYDEEKQIERERKRDRTPVAESLGAIKKIEKLLGILAILDLSEEVNEKHLKFAIDFTEIVDSTTEIIVEQKSIHAMIYDELLRSTFLARTDIVKKVKGVTLRSLADEMILVEELASKLGNSIIKKETSKMISYKLEKLSKTDINKVILSINDNPNKHRPEGFVRATGDFFDLHKIINSEKRYSAGTFRNEHISDENYMGEQNLFIIDVDDGMSIEEAKSLFSSLTYLIATTKSHQIEKKQGKEMVKCDRYRIILPTLSMFHLEPEVYSEMYLNVLESLGIPAYDIKCRNVSRWYYGNVNGKHWYNKGEFLDIRNFIPDSNQQKEKKKILENYNANQYSGDVNERVNGAIRWFLTSAEPGGRNDLLFRLAMLLKDPNKINYDNWEEAIRHVNTCLNPPLPDNEVKSVIFSASRR